MATINQRIETNWAISKTFLSKEQKTFKWHSKHLVIDYCDWTFMIENFSVTTRWQENLAIESFWLPNLVTKKLGNLKFLVTKIGLTENFNYQKEMVNVNFNGQNIHVWVDIDVTTDVIWVRHVNFDNPSWKVGFNSLA